MDRVKESEGEIIARLANSWGCTPAEALARIIDDFRLSTHDEVVQQAARRRDACEMYVRALQTMSFDGLFTLDHMRRAFKAGHAQGWMAFQVRHRPWRDPVDELQPSEGDTMPPYKKYASKAQERWAHTPTGVAALGAADVAGKDKASKGAKLPARVSKRKGK